MQVKKNKSEVVKVMQCFQQCHEQSYGHYAVCDTVCSICYAVLFCFVFVFLFFLGGGNGALNFFWVGMFSVDCQNKVIFFFVKVKEP